jgi:hypothetical protein
MFSKDDLIFAYTRAQAIEDGVLVDVSKTAWEARIKWPVALTQAVWCQNVKVPEGVEGQDEAGRLWDILFMLVEALCSSLCGPSDTIEFQLFVKNDNTAPKLVTLKAVCGPDDDGSPCITVMTQEEN